MSVPPEPSVPTSGAVAERPAPAEPAIPEVTTAEQARAAAGELGAPGIRAAAEAPAAGWAPPLVGEAPVAAGPPAGGAAGRDTPRRRVLGMPVWLVVVLAGVLAVVVALVTVVLVAGRSPRTVSRAWTTDLTALSTPVAADHSVVFAAEGDKQLPKIVSLDPATGRVRWSADASHGGLPIGVGISPVVVDNGRIVVWAAPAAAGGTEWVSITAADAVTGRKLWTFGQSLFMPSPLVPCEDDDTAVCGAVDPVAGQPADTVTRIVLDAWTGRLRAADAVGSDTVAAPREIAYNLFQKGSDLVGVGADGRTRWTRPAAAVFGGEKVSPNGGWDLALKNGVYVGSLAYDSGGAATATSTRPMDLSRVGATAAFSAATGKTLWTAPRTDTACGPIPLDLDHPVRCVVRGTATPVGAKAALSGLDVTLQGFDLATGRTTWSWDAGDVPLLLGARSTELSDGSHADDSVLAVDSTHYVVRANGRATVLDLDRGPVPVAAATRGWCKGLVDFLPLAAGAASSAGGGYVAVDESYPCSSSGAQLDVPASTSEEAGALVGDYYVWLDDADKVRGGRVHEGGGLGSGIWRRLSPLF
jgi:hypothetical protein